MRIYIYIYIYIYIFHHVGLPTRICLTLSRHLSLSSITHRRSSMLYPVSAQSCCIYVLAGHPAFVCPYQVVHWSMTLMNSCLLLQERPECLADSFRDGWQVAVYLPLPPGLVQYCSRTCSILLPAFLCNYRQAFSPYVQLASMQFIHIPVSTRPLFEKKKRFILSVRSDFHMTEGRTLIKRNEILLTLEVNQWLEIFYPSLYCHFKMHERFYFL